MGYKTSTTKNRRLGTIVMSFHDFKLREKQISPTFSYFLIDNALLYHFLANWLAHSKTMTEKSVFHKAWSPEMRSQSFPVSCFWSHGFVHHQKWNLMLLVHQNTGKENRYQKFFFAIHISTLRRFNRPNIHCHIHFKAQVILKTFHTSLLHLPHNIWNGPLYSWWASGKKIYQKIHKQENGKTKILQRNLDKSQKHFSESDT